MSVTNIKLLILPSAIKARMSLHDNVDEKFIYPEIKAAQDLHIRPLLGSILFDKMLADIAANTLSGYYLQLMDEYLMDAICNYVMSELPEGLNYQFWNKGVASKTTDNSTQPSMSELYSIVLKYKKRAEHYAQSARLWLLQNAPQHLPEYYAPGGIDKVTPASTVYTCPIYLGDPSGGYRGPNRNPNYNSNDPYRVD